VAGPRRLAPGGRTHRAGRGPLGPVRLRPLQQRLRIGRRGQGWPHGGRARPRRRRGQPGPARSQGAVRLVAVDRQRSAHPPAGPRRRRTAGGDGLGHRDGTRRGALTSAAGRARWRPVARVLHQWAAVPGGVLRARLSRQGRSRDASHGRQHPAVHRHRGGRPEGELRVRRPARQLRRHRVGEHRLPVRAQHGRDPDGAVGAAAGPRPRRRPADRRGGGPPHHAGHRGRRGHRRSSSRATSRDQPGPDERPDPRGPAPRMGRRSLRGRAHPRDRGPPEHRGALPARARCGGLPRPRGRRPPCG
jgi:hypothetical protein